MELVSLHSLSALLALVCLEVVLGVDNIVFIAILVDRLKENLKAKARRIGLLIAMVFRILLLFFLSYLTTLTQPLFDFADQSFSGKDLVLLTGGLFLLWKATTEIHNEMTHVQNESGEPRSRKGFASVIFQIVLVDLVFSIDSVVTAIGMAERLEIMVAAIVIAVLFMMFFSGYVSNFIGRYPTFKMLALAFLLLVGVMLVADGFGVHINRNYLYFAMAFSLLVEVLNIKVRSRS